MHRIPAAQSGKRTANKLHRHEIGELKALLTQHPLIPAIRSESAISSAIASQSSIVYLLAGSLSTLDQQMQLLRSADKEVMVNLDLFHGLSRDAEAVTYLAASGIAGIISTHTDVLNAASAHGLYTIQRTFMIDSESIESSMRSLRHFLPDALELLPAPVAPRILPRLRSIESPVATVAGGLVASLEEADLLVRSGIDGVSIGKPELWCI